MSVECHVGKRSLSYRIKWTVVVLKDGEKSKCRLVHLKVDSHYGKG